MRLSLLKLRSAPSPAEPNQPGLTPHLLAMTSETHFSATLVILSWNTLEKCSDVKKKNLREKDCWPAGSHDTWTPLGKQGWQSVEGFQMEGGSIFVVRENRVGASTRLLGQPYSIPHTGWFKQ